MWEKPVTVYQYFESPPSPTWKNFVHCWLWSRKALTTDLFSNLAALKHVAPQHWFTITIWPTAIEKTHTRFISHKVLLTNLFSVVAMLVLCHTDVFIHCNQNHHSYLVCVSNYTTGIKPQNYHSYLICIKLYNWHQASETYHSYLVCVSNYTTGIKLQRTCHSCPFNKHYIYQWQISQSE